MAIGCLAKISPMNIGTGSRVDIYVTSVNDRQVTGLNGQVWEPALVQAPQLGISVWNGDFTSAVDPAKANLALNMTVLQVTWPGADAYMWIGAPVEIYADEIGTAWPWTKRFVGKVSGFSRRSQVLSLIAEADQEPFNKNILGTAYAGTGGAEGPSDLKNRPKPLIVGWAQNVEPILVDSVNNVYQFSGYGAIEAVSVLYERGSDFGASSGDYTTYANLVAATIPAGSWATCLAAGMIRLGAPAYGVITGDVKGHKIGATTPRLPGSVINALLTVAGISTSLVDLTSLASLDTNVPYSINVAVMAQTTFIEQARNIALSCNYQAGVSLLGTFFVSKISLSGSPALTLNAAGTAFPQVIVADEVDVSPPYYRTIFGANRCWRVHTADEVALTTTAEETAVEALLLAQERGKVWNQATAPTYAESNPGDTWFGPDGTFYDRVGGLGLLVGGFAVTLGGFRPIIPWAVSADQPGNVGDLSGVGSIDIDADYTGAITAALPRSEPYRLIRNGVDLTASAAWSVTVLSGSISAAIGATTGILSVNTSGGSLTSGKIRISAVYGQRIRYLDVQVNKVIASPPISTSSVVTGTFTAAPDTTSMIPVGPEMTITVGASGHVACNCSYTVDCTASASATEAARWYRWNGSAYVAIGTEVAQTQTAYIYFDEYSSSSTQGFGECSFTDTGRTPGVSEKYRLYMRNTDNVTTRNVAGSCSLVTS